MVSKQFNPTIKLITALSTSRDTRRSSTVSLQRYNALSFSSPHSPPASTPSAYRDFQRLQNRSRSLGRIFSGAASSVSPHTLEICVTAFPPSRDRLWRGLGGRKGRRLISVSNTLLLLRQYLYPLIFLTTFFELSVLLRQGFVPHPHHCRNPRCRRHRDFHRPDRGRHHSWWANFENFSELFSPDAKISRNLLQTFIRDAITD